LALPFLHWSQTDYELALQDEQGTVTPLKVTAHSMKRFGGSTDLELAAPALDWSNATGVRLSGKGIVLRMSGKKGEPLQYTLEAPELALTTPAATGQPFTVSMRRLSVSGSGSDTASQTATSLWVHQSHSEMASLQFLAGQTPLMQWNKLALDTRLKDNGDSVDLAYRSQFGNGRIGSGPGLALNDVHLDFSYLKLNKAALLKWQADSRALYSRQSGTLATGGSWHPSDVSARGHEQADLLMQAVADLVRHAPGFRIDRLSFNTPHGDAAATLEVNFDSSQQNQAQADPADSLLNLLRQHTSGKASLKFARALLGMGTAKAPEPQLEDELRQLVAKGLVKDDGRYLSAEARFDRNGVLINGKSLPEAGRRPATIAGPRAESPAALPLPPKAVEHSRRSSV
jgi:uncharacterized protein YdgA (DUF945 family)